MSNMFYETLEKSASVRLTRALNDARLGKATRGQLALLKGRGMPTDALGANLKIRNMLDQALKSSGDARVMAARTRARTDGRARAIDDLIYRADQKAYGDAPDALRFSSEYDYGKSLEQQLVDKARKRRGAREAGINIPFANLERDRAYNKIHSELVGGHSRGRSRRRSEMSIGDAYSELKRTRHS
jgi:hypothetical protein